MATPAIDLFWRHVMPEPNSGCWLWDGAVSYGYGSFSAGGFTGGRAHRWSYEHFVGQIPNGLVIDHLCRVKSCVNPEHLEAVTQAENLRRRPPELKLRPTCRKTHCPKGHPYSGTNLYKYPNNTSTCRICRRVARIKWKANHAALALANEPADGGGE